MLRPDSNSHKVGGHRREPWQPFDQAKQGRRRRGVPALQQRAEQPSVQHPLHRLGHRGGKCATTPYRCQVAAADSMLTQRFGQDGRCRDRILDR